MMNSWFGRTDEYARSLSPRFSRRFGFSNSHNKCLNNSVHKLGIHRIRGSGPQSYYGLYYNAVDVAFA